MSDDGVKIIDLLPNGVGDVGGVAKQEIEASSNTATTGQLAWNLVKDSAAEKLKEALNFDVIEVFATGWSKVDALREYVDAKKHPPDEVSIVHLGNHELVSKNYPQIEVKISGQKVCSLRFELDLNAVFKTASLTIRDGKIWSIACGECSAKAVLKYGAAKLAQEETPKVKFPLKIDLKNPMQIARAPTG